MAFNIVLSLVFMAALLAAGPAWGWQMQNLSKETRVFDEFPAPNMRTPMTKTAHPGQVVSFSNTAGYQVYDRQTGQPISNPGHKMMIVTKEGYLRVR